MCMKCSMQIYAPICMNLQVMVECNAMQVCKILWHAITQASIQERHEHTRENKHPSHHGRNCSRHAWAIRMKERDGQNHGLNPACLQLQRCCRALQMAEGTKRGGLRGLSKEGM